MFKGSFEKSYKIKSKETVLEVFNETFLPIVNISHIKLSKFDDLFLTHSIVYGRHFNGFSHLVEHEGEMYEQFEPPEDEIFSIEEIQNLLSKSIDSFDGIFTNYSWFDFNKSVKEINFSTQLSLILNRTDFQIKLGHFIFLSKYYDEPVSDIEKQNVAKEWVKLAFENLKEIIGKNTSPQ